MKEKPQPSIKQERPKRETNHPERYPSHFKLKKDELMSDEELKRWFELEGKTDTLHLGC